MKKPNELFDVSVEAAKGKANGSFLKLAVLGILAGAFIAIGAETSNMASFGLLAEADTYGLGRALAGCLFPVGLMLVVLAGAELFTGNCLMVGGVIRRQFSTSRMLRNWVIVYVFNMVGAVILVLFIHLSGQLHSGGDLLGAVTLKIAAGKVNLSFVSALVSGIMCNWLVCLGVWLAYAAETFAGKILGIFFPIWLFVTSGFEHSVANMYYIPAGILANTNPDYVQKAVEIGVKPESLDALNLQGFFVTNLIPVTIGNIIGGAVFVSLAYFIAYGRGAQK
ncbi:MAG: formate/nitrite transporter family protein [Clostridiales Family XIII bacterium]|nr:formate/nitrite transporter family protein [Clostridiales Family XIII bacterium]